MENPATPKPQAIEANGHPGTKRTYLMLQGLATPFFRQLATQLTADGSTLHKVNYCGGDWWFSPRTSARVKTHRFNGKPATRADFYTNLIDKHRVTDVILFGDCRPIHMDAIAVAKARGLTVWVFEEGYTRPGFITLEKGGTNDWSPLPRTGAEVKAKADTYPADEALPPSLPNPMPARVRMDLAHHFWNLLLKPLFFRFERHRPERVRDELAGWANRLGRKRHYKTENAALIKLYETAEKPYFFVPLQLNSDYQIREHSPYAGTLEFIREVIASFARHAPKGVQLMFKSHPLDNGMIDYRSYIAMAGINHGVADRINYLEGGDLDKFLRNTEGVVLINSTVGYAALKKAKPLKVLGKALYNMAGLADQRVLDKFWKNPAAPDIGLIADFLKLVRAESQIAGDFFTPTGIRMAAEAAAQRIQGAETNVTCTPTNGAAADFEEATA